MSALTMEEAYDSGLFLEWYASLSDEDRQRLKRLIKEAHVRHAWAQGCGVPANQVTP